MSAYDPYRPSTLPYIVASARDDCDARKENSQSFRENAMKTNYKIAIALVAGAAIGGAAIQGLHAQAKPKAYIVTESDILDAAAAAAYSPRSQAAQKAAGGRSFRTTGKVTAVV